jgi:hypothetical protein
MLAFPVFVTCAVLFHVILFKGHKMNLIRVKIISLLLLAVVATGTLAAPGQPIGGIVVKGGKNPGGQMLVLGTTNTKGEFNIKFADDGEYQLDFGDGAGKGLPARDAGDVRLDYVVRAHVDAVGETKNRASGPSLSTRFPANSMCCRVLLSVPKGGAEVTGVLQAASADASEPVKKGINQAGMPAPSPSSSPRPKINK